MSCDLKNKGFVGTKASECFEMPILFGILKRKSYVMGANELNLASMNNAIKNGDLLPLFEFHNPEDTSKIIEPYESGSLSVFTDIDVKKLKVENHLSLCGHRAMVRAANSGYEEFIEVTKDNKLGLVIYNNGDFLKGQDISRILVSNRKRPLADKPPVTEVSITYRDIKEFEDSGWYFDVDFSPFVDLIRYSFLDLSNYEVAGNVLTININNHCSLEAVGENHITILSNGGMALTIEDFDYEALPFGAVITIELQASDVFSAGTVIKIEKDDMYGTLTI